MMSLRWAMGLDKLGYQVERVSPKRGQVGTKKNARGGGSLKFQTKQYMCNYW